MIKGILINVHDSKIEVKEVKKELDSYYKILNCECIDIVTRKIGKKYYDIVCDDEGLLKDDVKISALNKEGKPCLVGNLFIVNYDDEGDILSLNDEDIKNILMHTGVIFTEKHQEGYGIVAGLEY